MHDSAVQKRGWDLDNWCRYLQAAGRPPTTVSLRRYHLERLAAAFPEGPRRVTLDDLVDWLASHGWSPNTRASYRASLRVYWSWAMAAGRVTDSPAHLLPPVKVPRGRPRPIPEADYRDALTTADDRLTLALRLGGQCGLRRGEIARVNVQDLEHDLLGWTLRVKGKGGHVRLVPLEDDLARAIRERARELDSPWLFPSSHGSHLTEAHLGKLVARHLARDLTTHTLRHRCGTVAYAGTRDLRAVQELLGHAKPETTMLYTAIPDQDIRAAMLAAA